MKKIFPHIFVLFAFCILIGLGTWQLQRLIWKTELIEKVDSRINSNPIALTEYKNIKDDEYKLLKLTGEFLFNNEIRLMSRTYNGKPGMHIFTPFKEVFSQKVILVDRGFVKYEEEYDKPQGLQEIIGAIRATQKQNLIMLNNDPAKNFWFWVDLQAMYKSIPAPEQDFYVDLKDIGLKLDAKPKLYPIPLPKKIEIYNEHLQYAITWYSISLVLLIIYYFRFWYKKPQKISNKVTKKK